MQAGRTPSGRSSHLSWRALTHGRANRAIRGKWKGEAMKVATTMSPDELAEWQERIAVGDLPGFVTYEPPGPSVCDCGNPMSKGATRCAGCFFPPPRPPKEGIGPHGDWRTYNRGCSCADCRDAINARNRANIARRAAQIRGER